MSSDVSESEYARRRAQLIWERGLPGFIQEVAAALAVPAETLRGLDRAAVAAAQALFSAECGPRSRQQQPAFVYVMPPEQRSDLARICRKLAAHTPARDMLLFWDGGWSPYAVHAPSDAILLRGVPQIGPAHELLFAVTEDGSAGLHANYEAFSYHPLQDVYELIVWGPGWLEAVADEPPSPIAYSG